MSGIQIGGPPLRLQKYKKKKKDKGQTKRRSSALDLYCDLSTVPSEQVKQLHCTVDKGV